MKHVLHQMTGVFLAATLLADGVWAQESTDAAETTVTPESPTVEAAGPLEYAKLRGEVAALRRDMYMMRETLDHLINGVIAELEAENAVLKQELKQAYALQHAYGASPSPGMTPRSYGDLLDGLREEAVAESGLGDVIEEDVAPPEPPEPVAEPPAAVPGGPPTLTIVKEWGRSPEQAETLGKGTVSLKGLIGLVPPGCAREDVEELGRSLREKYDGYENLNIEIYDNAEAAQTVADEGGKQEEGLVLSVFRHAASGTDEILYFEGGLALPVDL